MRLDEDRNKHSSGVEQVLLELPAMLDQHVALQSWQDEADLGESLISWVASLQVASPWVLPLEFLGQRHQVALPHVEASAQVRTFGCSWHQ